MRFSVKPIVNVKGNLRDPIVVCNFDNEKYSLLQPGNTYILAARYFPEYDAYFIFFPPYTYCLLNHNPVLSDIELKSLADNDEHVKALQAAYPNEILDKSDIKRNSTYNSYASRHYDAQGNLIDDTVVLHEQYVAAHPSPSATPTESVSLVVSPSNPPSKPIPSESSSSQPISWFDAAKLVDSCRVTEINDYHFGLYIHSDIGQLTIIR